MASGPTLSIASLGCRPRQMIGSQRNRHRVSRHRDKHPTVESPHYAAAGMDLPERDGTPFLRVLRFDTPNGKSYSQYDWSNNRWHKGKPPGPKIPYRLLDLIATQSDTPVFITEGEKCARPNLTCGSRTA